MKAFSVWRAPAHMLVHGIKVCETRTWPAPASMIGTRVAIASTKQIKKEETEWCERPEFQEFYEKTMLPPWRELPGGVVLGTALLFASVLMTEEFIARVKDREKIVGVWKPGNYAWAMKEPEVFWSPIPVLGRQGIFEWDEQEA
jgi:hypothetical protein